MTAAHTLHRGHKRLKPLIDFAIREGWTVVRTPGGHLKFSKQGFPSIYTGATAGDHRAGRITSQAPATREAGADG